MRALGPAVYLSLDELVALLAKAGAAHVSVVPAERNASGCGDA